jgi:hypothetical protein
MCVSYHPAGRIAHGRGQRLELKSMLLLVNQLESTLDRGRELVRVHSRHVADGRPNLVDANALDGLLACARRLPRAACVPPP